MEEVYHQLICLLLFGVTGIIIGILFDIFRIWRKSFKTADWLTCLQDVLFWLLTGFIVLFSIFQFNHGEIRSYVFIGIAIGIILYMLIISKFVVKYCVKIIQSVKKIIAYPIKIALKFIKKVFKKPIAFLQDFVEKKQSYLKKNISNFNKNHINMTKIDKKTNKKRKKFKEKEGIL